MHDKKDITACYSCGLVISVTREAEEKIACRRCRAVIKKEERNAAVYVASFSFSALLLFLPALMYPVLDISVKSLYSSATILSSIQTLYSDGLGVIGALVLFTAVIIPVCFLFLCFYVSLSVLLNKELPFFRLALRLSSFFKEWHMSDVFLLGILISIVKLIDLAKLNFDYGIYLLILICIFTAISEIYYEPYVFRMKVLKDD